ncbi:MAG: DUF4184 family protein [Actinomycetia bacterium]|nr:DUF4184 family protein [Actinomycetes bacterium]
MPLTWLAHQTPVVPLKLAKPHLFDATALCVGSMMPDLMYSFSAYVNIDTHRWPSAYTYGVPLAVTVAYAVRFILAPHLAPRLPDLGSMRLRSYAVLADRFPNVVVTMISASLGITSHLLLDTFTHPNGPGVRWLGYADVSIEFAGHTEPLAGVFQLVGHTFGSLFGLWLFWHVGKRRLLERWYGEHAVTAARAIDPAPLARTVVPAYIVVGFALGLWWGWNGEMVELIQRPFVGLLAGSTAAGVVAYPRRREDAEAET